MAWGTLRPLPMILGRGFYEEEEPDEEHVCTCPTPRPRVTAVRQAGAVGDGWDADRWATQYGSTVRRTRERQAGLLSTSQVTGASNAQLCEWYLEPNTSDADYDAVTAELSRRGHSCGGSSGADDGGLWGLGGDRDRSGLPTPDLETQERYHDYDREEREALARGVADRVEPGTDPESARRRDAIITTAINGGLGVLNGYLAREYGTAVETIRRDGQVTLAQLSAADRQRQREYDLEVLRRTGRDPRQTTTDSGGGTAALALAIPIALAIFGK